MHYQIPQFPTKLASSRNVAPTDADLMLLQKYALEEGLHNRINDLYHSDDVFDDLSFA